MKFIGKSKKQKMIAGILVSMCALSSAYAATSHWQDASATPQTVTSTVAGEKTNWEEWKQEWNQLQNNHEQVSIVMGDDETKLNFAWYSLKNDSSPVVKIADNKDMNDPKMFIGKVSTASVIKGVQYYSNKVDVSGLKPNSTYWYQVQIDGKWQTPHEIKTGNPDDFYFMYVGDPQIGASRGQTNSDGNKQDDALATRNDAYNWNKTLNLALAQHPEINFLVSPGDQVNESVMYGKADKNDVQEMQYIGYLSAKKLQNLPEAPAIGNHDSLTPNFSYHFNTPNTFTAEESPTAAGHGYYYKYGNALFMVINTNDFNAADHEKLIKEAIAKYPNVKWRIVVMHQDIYGTGKDHSDSDGMLMRTQLTPIFDANKIDVVLQGHDHTYSRTYQLSSDGKQHDDFAQYRKPGQNGWNHMDLKAGLKNPLEKQNYLSQNICYTIKDMHQGTLVNPKGVLYITSNSATGSKFYELIPQQQDYIAARSQTWRPTYSVMHITGNKFSVMTYDVLTGEPIDESYTIIKR